MGGIKKDSGKPKIHLIPTEAIFDLASVLTWGETKYGTYNFMSGIEYTRLLDASMRHILSFTSGEDIDKESGHSHIAHAMANLSMLIWMTHNRSDMDDRPARNVLDTEKKHV